MKCDRPERAAHALCTYSLLSACRLLEIILLLHLTRLVLLFTLPLPLHSSIPLPTLISSSSGVTSAFGHLQCLLLPRQEHQHREHPDHFSVLSQSACAVDHAVEVQRHLNHRTCFQKQSQRNHNHNQSQRHDHREVGQARQQVQRLVRLQTGRNGIQSPREDIHLM
jgi:hypothetical protein